MTKEKSAFSKSSPVTPPSPAAELDLSSEINATLSKQLGETVKCVRVYDDNYRCNWWGSEPVPTTGRPMPEGFDVTVLRVRKSSFLRATKTPQGLQIQDMTFASSPPVSRLK